MSIYDKIDEILKKKHMSRRQLAQLAGIPESSLAAAFARKSKMSMERLRKIAYALQISLDEIVPGIGILDGFMNDCERMQKYSDEQEAHLLYLSKTREELIQNSILDKLNTRSCIDNLYTVLALALALNEDGQEKVIQYMLDINKISVYVNMGVRVLENVINGVFEEVTPCPEDAPQTAAEHNPGSDLTDAGNADTKRA